MTYEPTAATSLSRGPIPDDRAGLDGPVPALERAQVVRVECRDGTVGWLGPESPFGSRPLVPRPEAEVLSAEVAGRVEWAWRRSHAWRGDQPSAEDA